MLKIVPDPLLGISGIKRPYPGNLITSKFYFNIYKRQFCCCALPTTAG